MAVSWLGEGYLFPNVQGKWKKYYLFSNKDMMSIYLLSSLAGGLMSTKLYWEADFDMGGVPVKKHWSYLVLLGIKIWEFQYVLGFF